LLKLSIFATLQLYGQQSQLSGSYVVWRLHTALHETQSNREVCQLYSKICSRHYRRHLRSHGVRGRKSWWNSAGNSWA